MSNDKLSKFELMQNNRSDYNNTFVARKSKSEPFRVSDNVMQVGKYKGQKVSELPHYYIRWMIKKIDMDGSRVQILRNILKNNKETQGGNK
jgi:uncharacterized protein (DUF3820 family)